ncbi:SPOR domain-containing protein [Desulfurobacterium sp.]
MEGNRKLYYVLMAAAVVLLMISYAVGFVVGKNYGYNNARKEFEAEKQKLLKTIASLTPLSRPKPEEKVVIVNGKPPASSLVSSTNKTAGVEKKTAVENKTKEKQTQVARPEKKPTKTVKNESKKEVRKPVVNKEYYIQLGIFSKRENAERFAAKLKKTGVSVRISRWKNYYRVTAGNFTEKEARQVLAKLKKLKISGIIRKRR